ncbi:MAG: hypothetical protein Q9223_002353 [Gallowayella weberi]
MVDPSLLRQDEPWLQKTHLILDEMVSRGNLVAGLRKDELEQLDETLTRLHAPATNVVTAQQAVVENTDGDHMVGEGGQEANSSHGTTQYEPLLDWNSEEGLTGDQLIAVADSLDFTTPDWLTNAPLGQLEGYLY